ncbi:unnamed protein product [Caenorhabditis brenneri]
MSGRKSNFNVIRYLPSWHQGSTRATAQQQIVDAHNSLRSQIAKGTYVAKGTKEPAGADILKMKWDSSVGTSAQNYANTCPTGHSGAAGLGENIF